jgi:hypothetical protein
VKLGRALLASLLVAATFVSSARSQDRLPCDPGICSSGKYFKHFEYQQEDWTCGTFTYGKHDGSDFLAPYGSWVRAAVDGIISRDPITDCYDQCTACMVDESSSCFVQANAEANYKKCTACGSGYGNRVYLSDRFGRTTVLAHMETGEVGQYDAKGKRIADWAVGDFVACGTSVGKIGSSGYSTAPHVHITFWQGALWSGLKFDPFAGKCSPWSTYWTNQGTYAGKYDDYSDLPSHDCYVCEYEPGATRHVASAELKTSPFFGKNYESGDDERMAFQSAHGYIHYWEDAQVPLDHAGDRDKPASVVLARLGCAADKGGGPFVHKVHRIRLQDFQQDDTSLRFSPEDPNSDGWTAIVYDASVETTHAYLLRNAFWGAYKCLAGPEYDPGWVPKKDANGNLILKSGNVGGAHWLGVPINNEYKYNNTTYQDFQCGSIYVSGSTIKVHLDPTRSPSCPKPKLDYYTLVALAKDACPGFDIAANEPVGAICPASTEVCGDGKDNDSDGAADEGCSAPASGSLRIRYSVLGCAGTTDVMGQVDTLSGQVVQTSLNPPYCRATDSDAIVCDVPLTSVGGQRLLGNVITTFSGVTHSMCERSSSSEPWHWFGSLTAEWNGQALSPEMVVDVSADQCRFRFTVPDGPDAGAGGVVGSGGTGGGVTTGGTTGSGGTTSTSASGGGSGAQSCPGQCFGDASTPVPDASLGSGGSGGVGGTGGVGGSGGSCSPGYANHYPICTPLCSLGTENTVATGGFGLSAITWDGLGYGLVYQTGSDTFERLDAGGVPISSPTQLTTHGDTIGIAWDAGSARYGELSGATFQCVTSAGALQGAAINLCGAGNSTCKGGAISSDSMGHFGVTWADNRSGNMLIYFNRVDAGTCTLTQSDTTVSTISGTDFAIAFGDIDYALAWVDGSKGLWVTRLDKFGAKLGDLAIATGHTGVAPAIAWNANAHEWGVVWNDQAPLDTSDQIYFQRMNESGALVGSIVRVTNANGYQQAPRIASNGTSYGLLWIDGAVNQASFLRLDATGQPTSPKLAVTGNYVGTVSTDESANYMTVYQPGRSRRIDCQ